MRVVRVVLLFAAVVVVFDVLGAFASRAFGFEYGLLAVGSWLIYAAAGFLAAERGRWMPGVLAGAATGLVDATIGWAASWLIGPGRPPGEWGPALLIGATVSVVITAAIVSLVGAAARQYVPLRSSRETPEPSRPPA